MTKKDGAQARGALEFDRGIRAHLGQMTSGMAPSAFSSAWAEWAMHIGLAPARRAEVRQQALERAQDTWQFALRAMTGEALAPGDGLAGAPDRRFANEAWSKFPYNVWARAFQNQSALMRSAVQGVDGVTEDHSQLIDFSLRLLLDATSPSNFLASNPELLAKTQAEGGQNLVRGIQNWFEDLKRTLENLPPPGTEGFEVGRQVAATAGKVVFRNELIELIQYSPTTEQVHAEPVLIWPAWIMKYYILDLSQRNSLVKFLVDQGHTVFMVSWKNPGQEDRDVSLADYVNKGFFAALDAATTIVPKATMHAVGYCIGGTLLSIGAALLGRQKDERLASVTLFAAQTDFSEPGELSFFINPAQLAMLDASMQQKGVLESKQMGGAFVLLRAQDLLWQPIVDNYVKGERTPMIDLMAWNADGTRMPCRMHSEYLYRLYLDNELAANRLPMNGTIVRLSDIRVPMFVVGTEADHVAPWKSVYKTANLVRSDDYTFLLTAGGHNAGIVCGPVHPKRHYRMLTHRLADPHLAPEEWEETAPRTQGAWWPAWQQWLAAHSGAMNKPPAMGAAKKGYAVLEDAPGSYVKQR
ncbi:MAG: hypothetical protein RIQ60_1387 [Pseudomonadota bacterium]